MTVKFIQKITDIRASINYLLGHNHDLRYFIVDKNISINKRNRYNIGIGVENNFFTNLEDASYGNIGIGSKACNNITTGKYNVGIGTEPFGVITGNLITGNSNIGIGYRPGEKLTSGSTNIFLGEAGRSITTGTDNIFNGFYSGGGVSTGSDNIGLGNRSLGIDGALPITGDSNIGIGRTASGRLSAAANNNIAIGQLAGYYANSGKTTYMGDLDNTVCIGQDSYVAADGHMALGNAAHITAIYSAVGITVQSDERNKNFLGMDLGLDFINSLEPEKYKFKVNGDTETIHYGFSAQNVKKNLEEQVGNEKRAMHKMHGDTQALTYTEFVAPLVKAVQELSQQNEMLLNRIEALENKV